MLKAKEYSLINGFEMGKEKVMVSHLQFADDTLFFIKNDDHSLNNLIMLLDVFCSASGLKINLAKSQLLGINVDDNVILEKAMMLGCEAGQWPLQHLVLPLGVILVEKCLGSRWLGRSEKGWMGGSDLFIKRWKIIINRISSIICAYLFPILIQNSSECG